MKDSSKFENAVASFVSFNEVPARLAAFDNFIEDTAIAMRPSPSSNSWSLAFGSTCFPSSSRASALSIDGCDKWKERYYSNRNYLDYSS